MDVTEFQVGQEKLYFSALMDLANREVIAYNFSIRPKFSLVKKMLAQGLSRLKPTECPIIHSDRGGIVWHGGMDEYVERKSDTKHESSRELLRQCGD